MVKVYSLNEFDFILEDRIAKIQAINKQYDLENNASISFSGGKDSCVLSALIDLALPNNKIPRVYANTGIEYLDLVSFVRERKKEDSRFVILNQNKNIKKTLETYGYPFKSKEHSLRVADFNKGSQANYINKYITGIDKNGKKSKFACPKILLYQFKEKGKFNYSRECCYKLKKDLLHKWQKEHNINMVITGMRNEEGGNRTRLSCITNNGKMFHPLVVVSEEWKEWFIKQYQVKLCKLYYPPYNFTRTGCRGCPFSLTLEKDLLTMKEYLPFDFNASLKLWKPVYDEYVRLGYRLSKDFYIKAYQLKLDI